MFSLIITIISIALVAVLALASIYYGGSAVGQGSDSARASQLINEGQQLQGLAAMSVAQGNTVTSVVDLVTDQYLSQPIPGWTVDGAAFVRAGAVGGDETLTKNACDEVNARSGALAATEYADVAAASDAVAANPDGDAVFFCANIGAAGVEVPTVVYRF